METKTDEITEILNSVKDWSANDLHELNHRLVEYIKGKRSSEASLLRYKFKVGQRVKQKKLGEGEVVKVNRKRCVVKFDNDPLQQWNVSFSSLEIIT